MPRRIRTITRSLTVWFLALAAALVLSHPAAAHQAGAATNQISSSETVSPTAPTSSAPATSGLTSEDLARSSSSASKWLWIIAPFAILALWFGFNRLWRSPAPRA